MQLDRLIDFTRTFLRADGVEPPPAQHIRDLLNQAQDEMSMELRSPSTVLDVTAQTTPFNLPSDARDTNPLIYVRWVDSNANVKELDIVSLAHANIRFPDWQEGGDTGDPEVAIFSEGATSRPDLYIYPDPGSSDYHIHYVVKPDDMSAMDDVPLNGEYPAFHIALAHKAAFDLAGNDQRFAIYSNFLKRAGGNRRRGPKVTANRMYDMRGRWYSLGGR